MPIFNCQQAIGRLRNALAAIKLVAKEFFGYIQYLLAEPSSIDLHCFVIKFSGQFH